MLGDENYIIVLAAPSGHLAALFHSAHSTPVKVRESEDTTSKFN